MRLYIALLILCGSLVVPALADEPDALPARVTKIEIDNTAMSKRVTELEKADFVLHEDLARTHLDLTVLLDTLQTTLKSLDTKLSTQNDKDQQALLALNKMLKDERASRADVQSSFKALQTDFAAMRGATPPALQSKLEELDNQLALQEYKKLIAGESVPINLTPLQIASAVADYKKNKRGLGDDAESESLDGVEDYRLRIENVAGGAILVSRTLGKSWELAGHVISPVEQLTEVKRISTNMRAIASAAVNQIAICTDKSVQDIVSEHTQAKTETKGTDEEQPTTEVVGKVFYILPQPTAVASTDNSAPTDPALLAASIQTDIRPQEWIFSNMWVPMPGSPVYLETTRTHTGLRRIPQGYQPKHGDILVIRVVQ